jgi:hypothetical protein
VITVRNSLVLGILLTAIFCSKPGTTDEFAEYLQEEKQIRETVSDPGELEDSLNALKKKHNIDPDREISKLQDEPADWISLLRGLKSAK